MSDSICYCVWAAADQTEAELDGEFSQIKDRKGLPPETVRSAIREQLRVQRFFSEGFARFVSATDTEMQKYYDEVLVPAARTGGLTAVPPLTDVREEVRTNVLAEKRQQT